MSDLPVSRADMAVVHGRLWVYYARYASFFGHHELRRQSRIAHAYLQGLLRDDPPPCPERDFGFALDMPYNSVLSAAASGKFHIMVNRAALSL